MGWKVVTHLFKAFGLVSALVGLLYLPDDLYGAPGALKSWGPAVGWLNRELALAIFSSFLVVYIIFRDLAPFVRDWFGGKFSAIKIVKNGLSFRAIYIKKDEERNIDEPMLKVFVYLRVLTTIKKARA